MVERYDESTIVGTGRNRALQYRDKVYLRSRFDKSGKKTEDIHEVTWAEFDECVRSLCKGLDALGVKEFDRVGVFGPNTPRWIMATDAAIFVRGVFVPIYPNSKPDDVWWILHDSGAKVVFCHGQKHLDAVLSVRVRVPTLERIIVMEPGVTHNDDRVLSFDDLLSLGRSRPENEEELERRFMRR